MSQAIRFPQRAWLVVWFGASLLVSLASWIGIGQAPTWLAHHLERSLQGSSWSHWLGTDTFGRDLLVMTLQASATSTFFALTAASISIAIAVGAGTALAVAPAAIRFLLARALDALLAFPSLLFALAWAAVRGPGWDTLIASLLLGTVPPLSRFIYSRSLEILNEDYVTAARSLGASRARIALKHLAPAAMSICRVKAPNLFAQALLAEATLSFLGIGAPIGRETWGALLAQGKDYLIEAPHLAISAGLPLMLTILCLQLLEPSDKSRSRI